MSCVAPAAAAIDPREEMDDAVLQSVRSRTVAPPTALKTKFLIRTLPKDCNPTPVTAVVTSPSSLLSPTTRKSPHSKAMLHAVAGAAAAAEAEEHLPDNPFDDITEEKLVRYTLALQQTTDMHERSLTAAPVLYSSKSSAASRTCPA